MTAIRYWQDLTTDDFQELGSQRTVVVLPVGAIEQHGPHLPLSTDATIAEHVCKRAAGLLPDQTSVLVMPTQAVGKSNEHQQYPGTLTYTTQTLMNAWLELGDSIFRAGLKKLVFFNAHGGQPQVVEICCRELRIRHQMLCVAAGSASFGEPPEVTLPDEELRYGIHAGAVETSIMLHLVPHLVRMEHARNFSGLLSQVATRYRRLEMEGRTNVGWQAQDLHPSGCAGDATLASPEIGKAYVDHLAKGLAELLTEVADFSLDQITDRPGEPQPP